VKIVVIGDVGGHFDRLRSLLEGVGAKVDPGETPELPADTHVIQVGDLIDRGPESAACVALADRFLRDGSQWTQMFGNHEGNRLGARVFWDEPLDAEAEATIRGWWDAGMGRLAVGLRTEELGDVLVTHGGLVRPLWSMLGEPDCAGAARALNALVGENADLGFSSGALLSGGVPGPAWADAARELYASWEPVEVAPFGQIHGHSPVLDWPSGKPLRQVPRSMRKRIQADMERQHSRIDLGGRPFVCVDPGLGTDPTGRRLVPLVLTGEILE
jgi:hypothetical protein